MLWDIWAQEMKLYVQKYQGLRVCVKDNIKKDTEQENKPHEESYLAGGCWAKRYRQTFMIMPHENVVSQALIIKMIASTFIWIFLIGCRIYYPEENNLILQSQTY